MKPLLARPARPYEADADGLKIRVRLTPRGGRDALEGVESLADGRTVLKARVRAAPEKGLANTALETLLADNLDVPKSAASVIVGRATRMKVVRIVGDPIRLAAALEGILCV